MNIVEMKILWTYQKNKIGMGDISIGEISRLFKALSIYNQYESVTYRVLGIGNGIGSGMIVYP